MSHQSERNDDKRKRNIPASLPGVAHRLRLLRGMGLCPFPGIGRTATFATGRQAFHAVRDIVFQEHTGRNHLGAERYVPAGKASTLLTMMICNPKALNKSIESWNTRTGTSRRSATRIR